MSAVDDTMSVALLDHRFGLEPGFPIGVEEELLLVEPATGALLADAEQVVAEATPDAGRLASEIFASEVELVTPVCRSLEEVNFSLSSLLADVRDVGAAVIGAGLHPASGPGDARLSSSPRYSAVSDSLQGLLRTPPAALHVHVGMPDPETAIRACNGLRRHLPLLHSLSANSPFWYGRDSGLASARAAVLRSYPRYGVPRWFRDWEDFLVVARELADAAHVPDYTYFWWDVRPHPRLGTVEVRAPDTQFSLERTLSLTALIYSVARMETEAPPPPRRTRDAVEEACYQATRYGLDATLPDDDGVRRPARVLAQDLLDRVEEYARELGCEPALDGIVRILREGDGARIQRSVHQREGMTGLLRWLRRQREGGVDT